MKLILAVFFSLSAFLLQAQSFFDNHAFSLSGGLGFLYGLGDELLYQLDESGYLSRLGWDIKPLICYELSLDLAPKKALKRAGFFSSLALKAGIFTEGNGLMRDYDWVGGGPLTHYSEHDAVIDRAFMAAFQAGAVFPVNSSLALKLFGGL
ncbi:MAG: omptin family outer membrane protease, partial [Treponema sp.]|nr:omptin family outer membrane protease [Treponema sp.]